jgi:hypothetical protein
MMAQDVVFGNFELEIEDVEVFPFDATNVSLAENASAHRPVDIFECGIVEVLWRHNECSQKYAFQSPLFQTDMQMVLCSLDVYEGDKKCRHGHFGAFEHTGNELCEFDVLWTFEMFLGGRRTTKGIIDSVDDDIHCIADYIFGDLDINELEDCWRMSCGVDKTEPVERRGRRWGSRRCHGECLW